MSSIIIAILLFLLLITAVANDIHLASWSLSSDYCLPISISHFTFHSLRTFCCILNCAGGLAAVHSYGRLIPHEFPITDLQQISGPDGIGRITCIVSSGTARFFASGGRLEGGGVFETRKGATTTLVVNPSNVSSFQNRGLLCTNINTNFFYLFISSASKFPSHYCIILIYKEKQCILN